MRNLKNMILILLFSTILFSTCSKDPNDDIKDIQIVRSSLTIMQLPSQNGSIMNSYILLTRNGKCVVFDGGCHWDSDYLYRFLTSKIGNHVDAWFITHTHPDHVDALITILNDAAYDGLIIDTIYASLLSERDVRQFEANSLITLSRFKNAIESSNQQFVNLKLGQTIKLDSITFDILGIKNPEITTNFVNNSSVVIRVSDNEKSALFLGDLGIEGGNKILENESVILKSDFVQMSHHGLGGVSKDFYIAVDPTYCFWPTPKWLWERAFKDSPISIWDDISNVRSWMDSLEVERHFVMAEGFIQVY